MSTRSSSTDLFPPFEDPGRLIRRRNHGEPSLLLDFEEINMNPNNNQNPPPVGPIPHNHDIGPPGPNPQTVPPDLRTKEKLLHVPTDSVGDAIVVPPVLASQFELKIGNKVSSVNGSSPQNDAIIALTNQVEALGKHISTMYKPIHFIQESCVTCGGPHHYSECQATSGFTQGDVYVATGNYNLGVPPHPPPFSSKEVKRDPESTMDQVHISSLESTARIPSLVVQPAHVSKPNEIPERNPQKPRIPYPSRLNKEKLQDKSDIQSHKFLQMFKEHHFNISLAKALALMLKYAKMLKDLFTNKEKLIEMANTSLNENCSAVLLKKLPKKLRDPRKSLMLPELVPTLMTLELANRLVAYPAGLAEDVFVQVDKFTFPADFVVVDYNVDPRFPLILGRPFLRMARALVDVHGEELILRVGDEKLTFNVDSTLKYPYKHGNESINMIDIIETTCEDHFHERVRYPYKHENESINLTDIIDTTCEDHFHKVLKDQKLIHPLSGKATYHFDHSLLDYEAFCFDVDHQKEKRSGNTTSHSDHSLSDYEMFCFDHQKESNSGSTTSHSDPSLLEYESFYFDVDLKGFKGFIYYDPLIDPPSIAKRSNSHHEEFADELAHIISPPEYDHFYFDIEADPGDLTRLLRENISSKSVNLTKIKEDNELKSKTSTKELIIYELNDLNLILSNAGFENRPPMLNKENYVPWSSRLLRYAKSRPNGKLIHNSIINGPYVRRMIPELGDTNREVPMNETFHVQTDDELTKKELEQIEADDQAIQTILLGLLEDIYASVDKKITSNLKFLNNLQPEWSRHVTIVHQTKDLHTADYTQLYDFLKYNQKEVDELKAERLAKTQDPLALMATSNNPYAFPAPHQDQPSFNQNYMQQPMPNPEDIKDLTTAMNMALALMAKAFKLNYSTPTNNNQRISSNPCNRQIVQPGNLNGYNAVQNVENQVAQNTIQNLRVQNIRCYNCRGVGHFARNCTVKPRRKDAAYLQTQLLIAQKEEAGIQLQAKEFDLMASAADLDEIEEVNANCIVMANLQQASTSGTQTNKAPVYDTDGSAKAKSREELYFLNASKTTNVSTSISIPNVELSDDTTPSVARKFLNEVKSTIVTLQHVVKHRMTLETHNWSSSAHQELHKIGKDETFPIVNQVDARVQNFKIQFLKEAAKFIGDFKSLAKEADESLAKHKALELGIERLLRAVVSQDIMSVVQKTSVVDTSNLQTELERTKERFKNCIIKKENEYAKL
nr:hypothetical protein [Tanacetum cinerariifolium]